MACTSPHGVCKGNGTSVRDTKASATSCVTCLQKLQSVCLMLNPTRGIYGRGPVSAECLRRPGSLAEPSGEKLMPEDDFILNSGGASS